MNGPQPPEKPDPRPPQRPNGMGRPLLPIVIMIGMGLLLFAFLSNGLNGNRREIAPAEFWKYAENSQLAGELIITTKRIEGENRAGLASLKADEPLKFYVVYNYEAEKNFDERLQAALKGSVPYFYRQAPWWEGLLPQVLLMGVVLLAIWFFLFRRIGNAASGGGFLGNFGRSRHRLTSKEHVKVTFADVAGIDEAKDEVAEIIEFLRNPGKFRRLGGRVPRGVLLVGEPGCGKTLLAKAIAGEAEVPFFSISGSDFVEMFVGVGASRVRDLFKQAKDSSPCIIFLDEIDAVGRRRGSGFPGGGHDEREQTLNAILVEMDGFDTSDQIIVIAATNRMDVLDPALTRPGRFDRQISVPLPDVKGRYDILRIYARKVKCGPDVDLHRMARATPMFSGADLEAMVNEAAIAATMTEKDFVEHADLEEARDKVRWGRARKSRAVDEKEKEMTAYHEAGHALVQVLLPDTDPLHKVSIIPRGHAGGATFSLPEKDRYFITRNYCQAQLRVLVAGRIAQEMFCGDIDSGASSDIAHATQLARRMVMDWGMSDKLGFIRYAPTQDQAGYIDMGKEYSDKTAEVIDEEVKSIMAGSESDTKTLLNENRDKVERIAKALLRYETLSADDVDRIIKGESLDKPTIGDLLAAEGEKSGGGRVGVDLSPPPPAPDASAGPLPEPG